MTAITTLLSNVPVSIEYDLRGGRATKNFDDASAAKRFFVSKEKIGKNPRVVSTEPPSPEKKAEPKKTKKLKISKGRPYYAGLVLSEIGLEAVAASGITDEMVARVDETSGKPNPTESLAWLKICFNVLAGAADAASK
jgi:hypothetical protein